MLADRTRTNAYIRALNSLISPGDVVLDLGTGSGVLAAAAARAGASKVYAVEQGPAAEWAERVIRSNRLDSQVEVIRGWSESLTLPQPVDLVVSETLGNQPFEEGILASLADASRRLTGPGARFIPNAIELLAFLVQTPDCVQEDYGLDLSCLSEWSEQAGQRRGLAQPQQVRDWTFLAQEVPLARAQFPWESVWEGETSLRIDVGGRVDAVVMAFRAELSPDNTLSTCPFEASRDCHWSNPVYWLAQPLEVRPGQNLRLHWSLRPTAQAVRLES
jgi:protein arginine N-methyltransferase 1